MPSDPARLRDILRGELGSDGAFVKWDDAIILKKVLKIGCGALQPALVFLGGAAPSGCSPRRTCWPVCGTYQPSEIGAPERFATPALTTFQLSS